MKKTSFLLPVNFKFVGILFFIAGLILGIARFYLGIKPDFLNFKMFAVWSSYFETIYLSIIRNNFGEELSGLLVISGLFFIAFSRERVENEINDALRLKSFFIAAYLNFLFMLAAIFFTFGLAFVYMMIINAGIGMFLYIVSFRFLIFMNRRHSKDS